MTPERARYFASISKEERAIRLELSVQKNRIQYLKEFIKYPIHMDDKRTMLRLMQDTRFVIKSLKKQLSTPRVNSCCIVCGAVLVHWSSDELNYCSQCGQKLR